MARPQIRIEIDRFSYFWTGVRRVRDREAPGSNPGLSVAQMVGQRERLAYGISGSL